MSGRFSPFLRLAFATLLVFCAAFTGAALAVDFPIGKGQIITSDGKAIPLDLEFALTPAQRQRGLMFRKELGEYSGMLFDYESPQHVKMWMENTPLPLDMLFISGDGVIQRIEAYTTPFSRATIPSGSPVRYVLELNGGFARSKGVTPGDRFEIIERPGG